MSMQRTDQTKEGPSNLISSISLDTILSGFSDYYQILKKWPRILEHTGGKS